jgi:hypothetical protein
MRKSAGIKIVRETLQDCGGCEGRTFDMLTDAGYTSSSVNRQLRKIRKQKFVRDC